MPGPHDRLNFRRDHHRLSIGLRVLRRRFGFRRRDVLLHLKEGIGDRPHRFDDVLSNSVSLIGLSAIKGLYDPLLAWAHATRRPACEIAHRLCDITGDGGHVHGLPGTDLFGDRLGRRRNSGVPKAALDIPLLHGLSHHAVRVGRCTIPFADGALIEDSAWNIPQPATGALKPRDVIS